MLKVSGEALEGSLGYGIDPVVLQTIANEVAAAASEGVQIAVVVGGGNFFRGVDRWDGMERATADYVGMLATVMNAICLQSALEARGIATRVQTAIEMQEIAEPYIRRRAIRHLERGRVVIFGAGTGNPFFTTDTAAALRAAEIGADAFFKATKVDGVYDKDPMKNPDAILHKHLTFKQVIDQGLSVMDETAITLCKENDIPIVVFNLTRPGNIIRAITGDKDVGTSIKCCCEAAMEEVT
jgi:uridylate kinase